MNCLVCINMVVNRQNTDYEPLNNESLNTLGKLYASK